MNEKVYSTHLGNIHYWINEIDKDRVTLVFLPGLTADHRLFDKQDFGTELHIGEDVILDIASWIKENM